MKLTEENIVDIASWQAIDDEFASLAHPAIDSILHRIESTQAYNVKVFEDGGLSNYVAFLVCRKQELIHEPHETYRQLTPLAVNLSLCAPVGVIGCIRASYGTEFCCVDHLEIDDLLDPAVATREIENFVVSVISESPFRLMHPDEVRLPLPPGIVPYEYCYGPEPWDKYFHAIFANTD
jgi:hypothetical protein